VCVVLGDPRAEHIAMLLCIGESREELVLGQPLIAGLEAAPIFLDLKVGLHHFPHFQTSAEYARSHLGRTPVDDDAGSLVQIEVSGARR